ncbi:MAG: DUF2256 domain-containing protein [Cyanobacteria bacterium]|nr:DUF2256 domain-containing protein [Cyanobacteriota bacterium]
MRLFYGCSWHHFSKICPVCGRVFQWRKEWRNVWRNVWDDVRYC